MIKKDFVPSHQTVISYSKDPSIIRNVCILAHVDHGKTTIADCLLATNGIINKRMIGDVRYLDDRKDEQEKGITMKCSSVSLLNFFESSSKNEKIILNLVDTPGHIDFTSEVKAALRICDGAIIVVDLVEGVSAQTKEALKLAYEEHCKMILILNKIDRLILELKLNLDDIFKNILRAIEDCNAFIAEIYNYQTNGDVDIEQTDLLFSPVKGNVIFACASDGWGYTLKEINSMFNTIIKSPIKNLTEQLWDFDSYLSSNMTIEKGAVKKNKRNLFIDLCIKPVADLYNALLFSKNNKHNIENIAKKLNINKITADMTHIDPKVRLRAILSTWKPLADVILLQCQRLIPSPIDINKKKIDFLFDSNHFLGNDNSNNFFENLATQFKELKVDTPIVIYITKMFCVNEKNLINPQEVSPRLDRDNFIVVALAKVFSGVIKTGQDLFILPQNHIPNSITNNQSKFQIVKIKQLYALFGRDLVAVDEVVAGNICGIQGLDTEIIRTATLSNSLNCLPIIENVSTPVLRNSIEPIDPNDLHKFRYALKILIQSDSCVQVETQQTGEYILLTAGEVHLAKCLEDLRKFVKVPFNISSPMVTLKETVLYKLKNHDFIEDCTLRNNVSFPHLLFSIIILPISENLANALKEHHKTLIFIEENLKFGNVSYSSDTSESLASKIPNNLISNIKMKLDNIFCSNEYNWREINGKNSYIWSISDYKESINLLINATNNYKRDIFSPLDEFDQKSKYDDLFVKTFKRFCKYGPICEEQVTNCAFIVTKFDFIEDYNPEGLKSFNADAAMRAEFCSAFTKLETCLLEPVFTTNIEVTINVLGAVHSIILKHHGAILDTLAMDDDEKKFLVKAEIPVIESNGFVNEIRTATSGLANPYLRFSRFKPIEGDPFYMPKDDDDEDEKEVSVRAVNLCKQIRKYKGLEVEEQVIKHGEKQRTLKKKK